MDIKKQIEYWINSSEDDLETAGLLIRNQKILFGLFLCHLCIEKAIKAHVVRCTGNLPPKIHNLSFLIEKTDLALSESQLLLCDTLMFYQLEGRYPGYYPKIPSKIKSKDILNQTKDLFQWLKAKL
ncbi:MAG: HEPN domain-containing protein [Marinilabiliales bacterium]|nr:MAG: HEPN domain-containing protein [Marinilabiliales bacterium]